MTPVEQARQAGYSDAEIASHLAGEAKYNLARQAGYSDAEILAHLSAPADAGPGAVQRTLDVPVHLTGIADPAAGEMALNLGTGAVAMPVAGLAGLVAAPFVGRERAAQIVSDTQDALTYQPRGQRAQQMQAALATPMAALASGADRAGEWVADKTGSPALGAATNTVIQAAPAVLWKGAGAAREALQARAAAKGGTAQAFNQASASAAANAAAEQYVTGTLGLDWSGVSAAVKAQLADLAASGVDLTSLPADAVARQLKLQSLPVPVPATRGQLMRDRTALRNEENVSETVSGTPIRDVHLAQNQALLDNLDVLKGKVSGTGSTAATATNAEEAGGAVQAAARAKASKSEANYNALYKKARETEPGAAVSAQPLYDMLQQNPEVQHLGFMDSWLKRGKVTTAETTDGIKVESQRPITLAELDDLRKKAVAIAKTGGTDGYYAGQVAKAVDAAMEQAPDAAKAWRAAREAYKAHQMEFSEQGAVADLVDNASRTDRATALENTVRTIRNGSLEDIRKVKTTLLTGGDEETRTAGKQAWREVRAQVVQGIKDEATKNAATNLDGSPNLTPVALKKAIAAYGPDKLDELLGPGSAKEVYRILDATEVVKTRVAGSTTVANALAFLEKGLGKVPGGKYVVGAAKLVKLTGKLGDEAKTVEQAKTTPIDEAGQTALSKVQRKKAASNAAPLVPLSQIGKERSK